MEQFRSLTGFYFFNLFVAGTRSELIGQVEYMMLSDRIYPVDWLSSFFFLASLDLEIPELLKLVWLWLEV